MQIEHEILLLLYKRCDIIHKIYNAIKALTFRRHARGPQCVLQSSGAQQSAIQRQHLQLQPREPGSRRHHRYINK